jgi:hypothetical protein
MIKMQQKSPPEQRAALIKVIVVDALTVLDRQALLVALGFPPRQPLKPDGKRARWVCPDPVIVPVVLASKAAKAKLARRVRSILGDLVDAH